MGEDDRRSSCVLVDRVSYMNRIGFKRASRNALSPLGLTVVNMRTISMLFICVLHPSVVVDVNDKSTENL